MHLQLESSENHSIQSYSDKSVCIADKIYECSLLINRQQIIAPLELKRIEEVDLSKQSLLLTDQPEIILIGHGQAGKFPSLELLSVLSAQRIGLEVMSIGAACRTFNILLNEGRNVSAVFIFP